MLEADPYPYITLDDLLAAGREQRATLPRPRPVAGSAERLGTLLAAPKRSAQPSVIIPEHRAAAITPAVVNASSGATEWLRIAPASPT
ncbi:MAG: hypothetical protein U0232_16985 [Thermomicrobiales bacterium]